MKNFVKRKTQKHGETTRSRYLRFVLKPGVVTHRGSADVSPREGKRREGTEKRQKEEEEQQKEEEEKKIHARFSISRVSRSADQSRATRERTRVFRPSVNF